ncbi:P-loop containing nucleoside triphosphate hydrolase protein [Aspergillus alliaceus]|uniref:P-loop containing nucleoside triphosphate hydrolase protein n=1 Tax=Petromyces alliaceus TaxID=209559 RepID=A0A5N7CPC6_PETAA|nr:P-loop containing nucleoside triphosphate hydrolase protein [Aspergillus alliaceus]
MRSISPAISTNNPGMRLRGNDPRPFILFTFVFKGAPGTGKTATARIIGQMFYEMRFLCTSEVVECTSTDMVGEYLGNTGPKVTVLLERALGKVLFIDEAYRWAQMSRGKSGGFGQGAVGELVDCIMKPRYRQKIVIILAGYTEDMDTLIHVNPGLRSRIPTNINFPSMSPKKLTLYGNSEKLEIVFQLFSRHRRTRSWANGRDVETLARDAIGHVFKGQQCARNLDDELTVSMDDIIGFPREMLLQREQTQQNTVTEEELDYD